MPRRRLCRVLGASLVSVLAGLLVVGWFLDGEAERVVQQLYPRTPEGIIKGLEPIAIKNGHPHAMILIHGLLESPETYHNFIEHTRLPARSDVHVSLLPFHGRDLSTARQLDNHVILRFLEDYIRSIGRGYGTVVVMGHSYGGALLAKLARQGVLPQGARVILYAPAIYADQNDLLGRVRVHGYGLFRRYCNYDALGCSFPVYVSGDAEARGYFEGKRSLRYQVVPATLEVFRLDREMRGSFRATPIPFDLILAADDNRVDAPRLVRDCQANSNCHLHVFPSGRHVLHEGRHRKAFEDLVLRLVADAVAGRGGDASRLGARPEAAPTAATQR
jgi:pimeloyl-ACP methyl ester carboxylesterase